MDRALPPGGGRTRRCGRQLARGALYWSPGAFLPSESNRVANDELAQWIDEQPGEVLVLFHGHLAGRRGKKRSAHAMAVWDLLQYQTDQEPFLRFQDSLTEAVAKGRYSAIVLDQKFEGPVQQLFAPVLSQFEQLTVPPLSRPRAMQPVAGMRQAWPSTFYVRK